MSKYQRGEQVRIKRDLKVDSGLGVVYDMLKYKNELATITNVSSNYYTLDIDNGAWNWHEDCLVIPRNTGTTQPTQSTQSVNLDTTELLKELQNITKSVKEMKREQSPLEQAILEGVIEKAQNLATKDLEDKIKENLGEFIRKTYGILPKEVIEIRVGDDVKQKQGNYHKQFKDILTMVECGLNPLISGGAGSGKTHLCEQIADTLDYNFLFTGAITQEHKLLGYSDANGVFHDTQFYKWCTTPKSLFMFDEFDASDNNVVLTINTALANGYVDFPTIGRVSIPKENVFIASANTMGLGADSMYVGRNQLDSATLDRFTYIEFEYDKDIEMSLAYDKELYDFIDQLRRAISKNGLNELVSMRATKNASALLEKSNMEKSKILKYAIIKTMSKDTINTLVHDSAFNTDNVWYKEFRKMSDM